MQQGLIDLCEHATPSAIGVGPLRAIPKVGGPHHGVGAWPCLAAIRCGMSGLLRLVGCDGTVGESQSLTDLAKSDDGGIAAPSISLGSREPLEHVCGTSCCGVDAATVGTRPTGWERHTRRPKPCTVEAKILHNTRQQTDLYSGLPYTKSTGQST